MLTNIEKSPIGIQPEWSWLECRMRGLVDAMIRYSECGKPIPHKWIDELWRNNIRLTAARETEKDKQTTMEPQSRTFNLTETQLNEVRTVLKDKYGIPLIGDSGDVLKDGLKAKYDISHDVNDEKDRASLTITFLALPVLVSPENAWSVVVTTVNAAIKKFSSVS